MENIIQNITQSVEAYGPKILAAIITLVIAFIVANIVRMICAAAINKIPFFNNANASAPNGQTVGASIGSAGFWVIILMGLVSALEQLGMTNVSTSIRATLDQIFAFLPQIIGAIITFFVFSIVARVAKQAATATLNAAQVDTMPQRFGMTANPIGISSALGTILFALIIIPGGIAALQVLDIEAITTPAVNMLNKVMDSIPNIAVSMVIIGLFAVIARFVSDILGKTLPNTGLDGTVKSLGLLQGADAGVSASGIVAKLAGLIILLLGLIQGMKTLGFEPLSEALNVVLSMGSQIMFGSIIIFAGVLISGVVAKAMAATSGGAGDFAAKLVRSIIIILSVILGISRMGLDPSGDFILNAAQIILIGMALAGGIAFGLGGKDWAAKQLDKLK